jgi:hypothetical protein
MDNVYKFLIWALVAATIVVIGAFIGHTTISSNGIHMERPLTFIAFIITCILAILGK